MSKEYKPTEFSVHLSRSKMRKYLNDSLPQREQQEVELHLKHCVHCSNTIVEYVENEEPAQYKAYMAKLKGKLMNSVKPRKRKFTSGRIKIIRAAAAVTGLFIFSFFALGSMVKKDFNFISDTEKKENMLPDLKTSQKQTQKSKSKTDASFLTEAKTDEVKDKASADFEREQDGAEYEEEFNKLPAKKRPVTSVSKPKVTEIKPKEEVKTPAPAKVVEKKSTPALAEATPEKKENPVKKVEEKASEVEIPQAEEDKAEVIEHIQPLQKIEKIDAGTQNEVVPEAQNIQAIPDNGIGQLRQR